MMEDELLKLNKDIEELEIEYVNAKLTAERKKADLLINTDFSGELGKAKPTVAEKDSWVKLQCLDEEQDYRMLKAIIGVKKRELEIRLKFVGEE